MLIFKIFDFSFFEKKKNNYELVKIFSNYYSQVHWSLGSGTKRKEPSPEVREGSIVLSFEYGWMFSPQFHWMKTILK